MTSPASNTISKLLFDARLSGIRLSLQGAQGQQLQVSNSAPAIDQQMLQQLRSNSDALRSHLQQRQVRGLNVLQRIAEQARRHPQRLALADAGGTQYSYASLWQKVGALALQLQQAGVGPETRVGLLLPRSAEWVLAMLAILQAGGCYVALNSAMPAERIAHLCNSRAVEILLTDDALLETLPSYEMMFTPTLSLDGMRAGLDDSGAEMVAARELHALHSAYVIFTSGSTGQPKGVQVGHGALENLVAWHIAEYALDSGLDSGADSGVDQAQDSARNACSQLASQSFDAHIWEVFPPLCAGASLHLADEQTRLDMSALAHWINQHAISHCFLPTPLAEVFLSQHEAGLPSSLRYLLTGGDLLKRSLPPGPCQLVNHYGPTETAVVASASYVQGDSGLPPIGFAIDGMQAHILDDNGMPVAARASGELYLSGASLALSYLHNPRETALRFVPDPSGAPGARMYKTGDLVRLREDGQMLFQARADAQLKIRGVRIEPGEVENAILHSHQANLAAVVQHAQMPDSLTAFLTLPQAAEQSLQEHVQGWQELYDITYQAPQTIEVAQDFIGWNSSFDGSPLPLHDMREWADLTCERIRALGGKRILELGFGSGLLLLRLLPQVERYVAADFSAQALTRVQHQLQGLASEQQQKVCLLQAAAHEFARLPAEQFDVVVINSVCQYFPDRQYFARVIEQALQVLQDDGALFLGDVRDLRSLPAFQVAIAAARAGEGASLAALRQQAQTGIEAEDELLLAPAFFQAVCAQIEAASGVEWEVICMPKTGSFDNEISRYRYDVVIQRKANASLDVEEHNWDEAVAQEFPLWLQAQQGRAWNLHQVPLQHLQQDLQLAQAVWNETDPGLSLAALRAQLPDPAPSLAHTPAIQRLLAHIQEAGWVVRARLDGAEPGFCSLQAVPAGQYQGHWPCLAQADAPSLLQELGAEKLNNIPGKKRRAEQAIAEIKQYLRKTLPDYLIPARYLVLDQLPLTGNGKVDRQALAAWPLPEHEHMQYQEPQNEVERVVAHWFAQMLSLKQVGRLDNLYDLGGNSLVATRMVAKINTDTGLELPVHLVLENPVVADLAQAIIERLGGLETAEEVARIITGAEEQV